MHDDEIIDKVGLAMSREQHSTREKLRDTFAAAALTGLMTGQPGSARATAETAWRMADAMLDARDRDPESGGNR